MPSDEVRVAVMAQQLQDFKEDFSRHILLVQEHIKKDETDMGLVRNDLEKIKYRLFKQGVYQTAFVAIGGAIAGILTQIAFRLLHI